MDAEPMDIRTDPAATNPFRRALDGWDERSWTKGRYHAVDYPSEFLPGPNHVVAPRERWCSAGRLFGAKPILRQRSVMQTLAEVIIENYGNLLDPYRVSRPMIASDAVILFNDHPDTTFADVVSVFEKAAAAWDETVPDETAGDEIPQGA